MKMYKYCSDELALKILENRKIRAKHAKEFNDPFELQFAYEDFTFDQVARFYLETDLIPDEYRNCGSGTSLQVFGNWYLRNVLTAQFDTPITDEIARPYIEGDTIAELYKTNIAGRSLDDFTSWYKRDVVPIKVQKRLREQAKGQPLIEKSLYMKTICATWFLFCASALPDSVLMWSHYADNHKGTVLEFETEHFPREFLARVIVHYRQNMPVFRVENLFGRGKHEEFLEATATKALHWFYEQEIRFIVQIPPKHGETFYDVELPAEAITGVVQGLRTEKIDRFEKTLAAPHFAHVSRKHTAQAPNEYALNLHENFIS